MRIRTFKLAAFRNISRIDLEFHPRLNIFVGDNAQGKTNLMEGIGFLSTGLSFRSVHYRELIEWGAAQASVRGLLAVEAGTEDRQAVLEPEKKVFFREGKRARPNSFLSMPSVLFAPESILLFKESPSARLHYFDRLFTKLSPTYGKKLREYNKALSQRNRLLKEAQSGEMDRMEAIRLWEEPLARYGGALMAERGPLLETLNGLLGRIYSQISGSPKRGAIFYSPHTEAGTFATRFEERRELEIIRGITLVGPHRDHCDPWLGERPIAHSGSQGEMRTLTLGLKLAEIALFETRFSLSPILLLDDVLSELDENRARFFWDTLSRYDGQIFTTATGLHLFPRSLLKNYKSWRVHKGEFEPLGEG